MGLVLDSSAFNDLVHFRSHLCNLESGHKTAKLMRMGTEIVQYAGITENLRIRSPCGLRMTFFFQQLDCPAGGMLSVHNLHCPDSSLPARASRMPHHGVT